MGTVLAGNYSPSLSLNDVPNYFTSFTSRVKTSILCGLCSEKRRYLMITWNKIIF